MRLSPKTSRNIVRILPFGVIWVLMGWVFILVEGAAMGAMDPDSLTAIGVDFPIFLFATITVLIVGLVVGTLEVVIMEDLFRKRSFLQKIMYKFGLYAFLMLIILFIGFPIAASIESGINIFDGSVWKKFSRFLRSITFLSTLLQMAVSLMVCLIYAAISENLGHGVMINFFTGKYHTPKAEKRIFMFLDMKSSTFLDEKMGHVRYFEFLRDYYSDLSDAIIHHRGEVYQYIGDEIIVTWNMKTGLKNNHCINCFFHMENDLRKEASKYLRIYGQVPSFKAGIHLGEVTTGEIGALKKEIFYTGDVLNTTSRIQGLCNQYHVDLLVSRELADLLHVSDEIQLHPVGEAELKGKEETLELYAVEKMAPGKSVPGIVSYIFLFLAVFLFTSCLGQDKNDMREIQVAESPNNTQQNSDTSWVDPLFYLDGQLCAWVRQIFQDSKGNLWFSTNHYGIMRFDGNVLEYFTEEDGLGAGRTTQIVEDENGNIWIGTYGGLTKYDGKTFTNFSIRTGPIDNDVWSVIIDQHSILWLGTSEGVVRFDGIEFSHFPIPKPKVKDTTSILSYNRVSCILEDKNGLLWFGTDGFGICKYDPSANRAGRDRFTHITEEDGLCNNNVADLMEDKNGNIWVGTMFGGICRFDGRYFTNFTLDGLVGGEEAYGLYEDQNDHIWFAAENYGVYRYDGETFFNFHKEQGLNTNGIISIYEDREGRFWFGGWGGLFRYIPGKLQNDGYSFISITKEGPWH